MVKKDDTKATVTRSKKAKQEDLPGVEASSRRIAELEDLGDALVEAKDAADAAKEKVKEADENLVAAMKRREKTYYSRQTWGTITITEPTSKAKVKKASSADPGEPDEEEIE